MVMDLIGKWRESTPDTIKNSQTEYGPLEPNIHYNWTGWGWICNWLENHGVNMEEFSGMNDGETISRKTCKKVAETLEKHWDELNPEDQEWLKSHIEIWKWTLNFKQY